MFGTVLDKLDKWVGGSFLLASFFPFLIFLGANALMGQLLMPEAMKKVSATFGEFGPVSGIAVWLAAAAAIAYLTDPLVGKLMDILEGTWIPDRIAQWLSTDQTPRLRALENEEQEIGTSLDELDNYPKLLDREIEGAKAEGVATHEQAQPKLIDDAEKMLGKLALDMTAQRPVALDKVKQAAASLQAALKANCVVAAELRPEDPKTVEEQKARCARAEAMIELLNRLIAYTTAKLNDRRARVIYEQQLDFGSLATEGGENWIPLVAPTQFGNKVEAQASFVGSRFKFDFRFFWPIFQLVVAQGDQKTTDALTNAKQKLDFCVRILLYTIVFTAIWMAVIGIWRGDVAWLILVVGTVGAVLTLLWMETVDANYRSMSELIRGVVILKRFEVLKALHLQLPADWKSEQHLWASLNAQLMWGSQTPITYQHSDKP
ncbi:MAG TPA: hypothetical protein VMI56_13005 [Reyranella sp.]|nr:hypothetical protein [Reyranella sp.]